MNRKIIALFTLLAAIGVAGVTVTGAMSMNGDFKRMKPHYDSEVHEEMQQAILDGDYEAWVALREENNLPMNGKLHRMMNEETFNKYSELYKAKKEGDYETAEKIWNEMSEELGFEKGKEYKCPRSKENRRGFKSCPFRGE